jgi:hypothetical protein
MPAHLTKPVHSCDHIKNMHTAPTTGREHYRVVATVLTGYFAKFRVQQLPATTVSSTRPVNFSTHRLQGPTWMSSVKETFAVCTQCRPCSVDVTFCGATGDVYTARRTLSCQWRPTCQCEPCVPDGGGIYATKTCWSESEPLKTLCHIYEICTLVLVLF